MGKQYGGEAEEKATPLQTKPPKEATTGADPTVPPELAKGEL